MKDRWNQADNVLKVLFGGDESRLRNSLGITKLVLLGTRFALLAHQISSYRSP